MRVESVHHYILHVDERCLISPTHGYYYHHLSYRQSSRPGTARPKDIAAKIVSLHPTLGPFLSPS